MRQKVNSFQKSFSRHESIELLSAWSSIVIIIIIMYVFCNVPPSNAMQLTHKHMITFLVARRQFRLFHEYNQKYLVFLSSWISRNACVSCVVLYDFVPGAMVTFTTKFYIYAECYALDLMWARDPLLIADTRFKAICFLFLLILFLSLSRTSQNMWCVCVFHSSVLFNSLQ